MPQEEKLLTTGQFARAARTTKETLFHYDRIGLFHPVKVGENGYRYYSPRQFGVFEDIQNLQRMNMELADIRCYMDARSPEKFVDLLGRQIAATERELHRLTDSLADMQMALQNMREAAAADGELFVTKLPAVYGLRSHRASEAFGRDFPDFWARVMDSDLLTYNILCSALCLSDIRAGECDRYAYIYAQVNGGSPRGAEVARPVGRYLVAYHHGPYASIPATYRRMFAFAETHRLPLGHLAFEEYLLYEIAARNREQLVTKLLFQLA